MGVCVVSVCVWCVFVNMRVLFEVCCGCGSFVWVVCVVCVCLVVCVCWGGVCGCECACVVWYGVCTCDVFGVYVCVCVCVCVCRRVK